MGTHAYVRTSHNANTLTDKLISRRIHRSEINAHSYHQIEMRTHTHARHRYEILIIYTWIHAHGPIEADKSETASHSQSETESCTRQPKETQSYTFRSIQSIQRYSRSSRRMSKHRGTTRWNETEIKAEHYSRCCENERANNQFCPNILLRSLFDFALALTRSYTHTDINPNKRVTNAGFSLVGLYSLPKHSKLDLQGRKII